MKYQEVSPDYFARRKLRRYAGFWSLWALGVGAVISGDFFGWNFGLSVGGFGGLAIATVIVAVMYLGLCYSLAEMAPALPHAGGPYSFARAGLGPWGGFITGLAASIEYILTPAVIVVGIGGYMGAVVNSLVGLNLPAPLWWLLFYVIFVGINVWGVAATFRVTVAATLLALAILLVFWIGAIPHFRWELALNIPPASGQSPWLPFGWGGMFYALPFAVWFFLAIEQVPLAAEEAQQPRRDLPKALLWGILTLLIAAALTLLLNSGIAPGAMAVGISPDPLFDAFKTIFGEGIGAVALSLAAVAGLVASFHAIIYAYGRNLYSLSRAGYLPKGLSLTLRGRQTPHLALLAGAAIGYGIALLIEFGNAWFSSWFSAALLIEFGNSGFSGWLSADDVPVAAVLLNMAVFGAVISYVLQMAAFIRLRQRFPAMERPYVSPLGIAGAAVAGLIALLVLVFSLLNADYRMGLYGCVLWFAAGLLYFALKGRRQLVKSPEEEFAAGLY